MTHEIDTSCMLLRLMIQNRTLQDTASKQQSHFGLCIFLPYKDGTQHHWHRCDQYCRCSRRQPSCSLQNLNALGKKCRVAKNHLHCTCRVRIPDMPRCHSKVLMFPQDRTRMKSFCFWMVPQSQHYKRNLLVRHCRLEKHCVVDKGSIQLPLICCLHIALESTRNKSYSLLFL